jgi:hypothetical protein
MAVRTVGVNFEKLIPDTAHASAIRGAVERVHRCTLLATELLNLYVRDRLQHHGGTGLHLVCDSNWLLNAYNEVTYGKKTTKVISELRATRDAHMPAFVTVDRAGLTQIHRTANQGADACGERRALLPDREPTSCKCRTWS